MKRLRLPVAIAGYAAAAALMVGGGVLFAGAASAVVVDDGDGVFSLDANPYPFVHSDFSPGRTEDWAITAQLAGAQSAGLTLQVSHSGGLVVEDGLQLRLRECSQPFQPDGTCALPATEVQLENGDLSAVSTGVRDLGLLAPGVDRFFMATFSLPDGASEDLMGEEAFFAFTFVASNDSETVTNMPVTGGSFNLAGPLLLAGGLILAGLILARQQAGRAANRTAELMGAGR